MIRLGRIEDIAPIRAIERAAGQRFVQVGMADIAAHEPIGPEPLGEYVSDGRCWVATDDDAPVGYAVVDVIDGAAHIEQISVMPSHQGRGYGRALIDVVATWARAHELHALTLTTFDDVPWNRPLYEHLGFRVVPISELSAALTALREEEAGYGLDPEIRVVMRRTIS